MEKFIAERHFAVDGTGAVYEMNAAKGPEYRRWEERLPLLMKPFFKGVRDDIGAGMVSGLCFIRSGRIKKRFGGNFKETFVKAELTKAFANLSYEPDKALESDSVRALDFFKAFDRSSGNDLIAAEYRGLHFAQCDMSVGDRYTVTVRDDDGHTRTEERWRDVFKGRVMRFDFAEPFRGRVMRFDFAEPFRGRVQVISKDFDGAAVSGSRGDWQSVETELADFGKYYDVYATDPLDAVGAVYGFVNLPDEMAMGASWEEDGWTANPDAAKMSTVMFLIVFGPFIVIPALGKHVIFSMICLALYLLFLSVNLWEEPMRAHRMTGFLFLCAALFIGWSASAHAGKVTLNNRTSVEIRLAVKFYDCQKKEWVVWGWYSVPSGGKKSFNFKIAPDRKVYWCAKTNDGKKQWPGKGDHGQSVINKKMDGVKSGVLKTCADSKVVQFRTRNPDAEGNLGITLGD